MFAMVALTPSTPYAVAIGAATRAVFPQHAGNGVNVNEGAYTTMNAFDSFLSGFVPDGDRATAVAAVIATAKAARAAQSTEQQSLFSGFLSLAAAGYGPADIRAAGAVIRQNVTRIMRVAAGLPAVKEKGAKESGAPDFSTASAYAKVVADLITFHREDADAYENIRAEVENATEIPRPVYADDGRFFQTVSGCKALLDALNEAEAARVTHRLGLDRFIETDQSALAAQASAEAAALHEENAALRRSLANIRAALQAAQDAGTSGDVEFLLSLTTSV